MEAQNLAFPYAFQGWMLRILVFLKVSIDFPCPAGLPRGDPTLWCGDLRSADSDHIYIYNTSGTCAQAHTMRK